MILSIDTSAAQCAVALVSEHGHVVRAEPMQRGHAEALFPMIDVVLGEAGRDYDAITRIVVCTGPGSFTGLRVGISAARGMALGLGVPAIGVTRFVALHAMEGGDRICLHGPRDTIFEQDFDDVGRPAGAPRQSAGHVADRNVDPVVLAALGRTRPDGDRPAPLYLRTADAAVQRDGPPRLLD